MNKNLVWTTLFAAVIAMGCATQPEPASSPDSEQPDKPAGSKSATKDFPTDVVVFRNDKGEVVCPVMKDVISSPEKASSHVDHKGVRYYICCESCVDKFKENPAVYAKK